MHLKNYPHIKVIEINGDVFFGITSYGSLVWGIINKEYHATEIHPLYVRNRHSNFMKNQ